MPHGIVKSPADEKKWNAAKAAARKQYPNIDHDSDKFYAIVMTIFKKMRGR